MTIRKMLLSAVALMALAVPAMAQSTPPAGAPPHDGGPMGKFNADTDGDGMLSRAEFQAMQDKRFDEMDTNHDGKISKDEMKAHHEQMKERMKEKRGEWDAKKDEKPPVAK